MSAKVERKCNSYLRPFVSLCWNLTLPDSYKKATEVILFWMHCNALLRCFLHPHARGLCMRPFESIWCRLGNNSNSNALSVLLLPKRLQGKMKAYLESHSSLDFA